MKNVKKCLSQSTLLFRKINIGCLVYNGDLKLLFSTTIKKITRP